MTRMRLVAERLLFSLHGGDRLNGIEEENTARGFHLLLACTLCWVLMHLAVAEPFFVKRKAAVALTLAVFAVVDLGALHLVRTRRIRPAAILFLTTVWCLAEAFSALDGTLRSVMYGLVVLTIVNAGWLLGRSSAMGLAAATLLVAFAEAVLENSGHPLPRYFLGNPIANWLFLTGVLLFAVGPILAIVNTLRATGTRLREYERVVEGLQEQIAVIDREYRYVIANQAFLDYRGLKRERVIGHLVSELLGQDAIGRLTKSKMDECFQGKVVKYERALTFCDLGRRDIFASYFPIEGPDGIDRIAMVLEDVTEAKRAERQLQRSFAELHALTAQLQSVREEERTRLARELHDELGQALTAIKIDLASIRAAVVRASVSDKIASIMRLVDETIEAVRRISTALRPAVLDDLGLVAALEWAAEEFQARTGIQCQVGLPETDLAVDPESATALFRIFQEAVTNVARHAGATQVSIGLCRQSDYLSLDVRDNGCGIGEEQQASSGSLGILGMRERAAQLGGEFMIAGVAGRGTTVQVRLPCASSGQPGANS